MLIIYDCLTHIRPLSIESKKVRRYIFFISLMCYQGMSHVIRVMLISVQTTCYNRKLSNDNFKKFRENLLGTLILTGVNTFFLCSISYLT